MGAHRIARTEFRGNPLKYYRNRGLRVLCCKCGKGGGTMKMKQKYYMHESEAACEKAER